jgi:hypothetical protein
LNIGHRAQIRLRAFVPGSCSFTEHFIPALNKGLAASGVISRLDASLSSVAVVVP